VQHDAEHYASEAAVEHAAQEEHVEAQQSAYGREQIVETPIDSNQHPESRVNETQEIEPYREAESLHQENTWVAAPAEVVHQFIETPAQEFAQAPAEESHRVDAPAQGESNVASTESSPETSTEVLPEVVAEVAAQPNMDELVARVLSRMSPDVMQKVTRDILKPVIEALIQDELNSKK
jgi:hypothetical protein